MGAATKKPPFLKGQQSSHESVKNLRTVDTEKRRQNDLSKRSFLRRSAVHEFTKTRRTVDMLIQLQ